MIRVEHLTKRFGRTVAVDNLSFEVQRGEIVGFLGPNGAGKTTTMRVLACFLPPTGGTVTIDGLDIFRHSVEVRRRIGYLPENIPLYKEMRVSEYLKYRAILKGIRGKRLRTQVDSALLRCGLIEVRNAVIGRLSKGYTQRVGLADSLVHEPEVMILDEPTIGLDPNQMRHIRALIKDLARRHTVLLSSHILSEVETMCERVLIINRGKVVASDSPRDLVGLMKGSPRVVAEVRGPAEEIAAKTRQLAGIVRVSCEPGERWHKLTWECEKGSDVREELFQAVSTNGWTLRELRAETPKLEDVFAEITADADAVSAAEEAS